MTQFDVLIVLIDGRRILVDRDLSPELAQEMHRRLLITQAQAGNIEVLDQSRPGREFVTFHAREMRSVMVRPHDAPG